MYTMKNGDEQTEMDTIAERAAVKRRCQSNIYTELHNFRVDFVGAFFKHLFGICLHTTLCAQSVREYIRCLGIVWLDFICIFDYGCVAWKN